MLRRWFTPAPDSAVADTMRCGRSPWQDAVHLLWSAWLFITPLFGGDGYTAQWLVLTLVSYPLFLLLYARVLLRSEEHTSELQSRENIVCRLLLEKKNMDMRHT